ncbi:MAG: acetyl-CoA C-acetyltransferase [Alphaproteobacteria bacterium]
MSKHKNDIVILAAKRSAIGSFLGSLSSINAPDITAPLITSVCAGLDKLTDIGEVILGQILNAGGGQGPARQAAMRAGIPQTVPAMGINFLCGSGLKAVALANDYILSGSCQLLVAGGMESMSRAPHAVLLRAGLPDAIKMGDGKLVDTMLSDALYCAFHNYHMGQTAENIAKKFNIDRHAQDEFAIASQEKAARAIKQGNFKDEILPLTIKQKKGDMIFDNDEYPRGGDIDSLAKLQPVFMKGGSVTAGNASGLNDGAAALLVASRDYADKHHLKPMCKIISHASVGVDPAIMGVGPIDATKLALAKAGLTVGDLDLIESNEAFAAQSLAVIKELGFDAKRVNINGGAIALGHPVGASGARILVTLIHALQKNGGRYGLATLCVGGGMGVSMVVERE